MSATAINHANIKSAEANALLPKQAEQKALALFFLEPVEL
ncbi:hypothetical protein L248_0066 [Schleiferilactobacillus shenzhenensis LY-73]|uniref:Uncharacterized protein n=1 Tax=Schleiferilactobacillus shenzhenensis LY-73 TaxID=1231336 RepID=U4TYK3_9LACO|nr:hypothetical protein L248_0066 [Schleiferilactobacillus shenzhenensis LY-73]